MKSYKITILFLAFLGLPLCVYALGDFPRRSLLKEIISVLTIVAFFVMLMQFYLSRFNASLKTTTKMSKVLSWHKALGYGFVTVLLFHPLLILLPHYFTPGLSPLEAFQMMFAQWNSVGLILGIIAWVLMLVIGFLSYFRNSLKMKYTSWRLLHGLMSLVFIILAAWHVVSLGRHINLPLALFIAALIIGVTFLTVRAYVNPKKS